MSSSSLNSTISSTNELFHNLKIPIKRLRGGAAATAAAAPDAATESQEERASVFETEAEDEQLTGQKFAEIVDEVPPEKKPVLKPERIFRLLKTIILFGIWLVMTFFLMTTFDNMASTDLIYIPEGNESFYRLQNMPSGKLVGLRVRGPFQPQYNDSMYHEPLVFDTVFEKSMHRAIKSEWILSAVVQLVEKADDASARKKNISKVWEVELANPSLVDETEQINRDHIFKIEADEAEIKEYAEMRIVFSASESVTSAIALELFCDIRPVPELWGVIVGFIILIGFYVILLTDHVNRILVAMIGSTIAISILASNGSRPSMDVIMSWIDINSIMSVFSVTILMGFLVQTGVFDWVAVYSYEIFNGHIWPPINTLCGITMLLCCVFDKITVVLTMAPISLRLCEIMEVNPVPVLICITCFSNVGSIWTLTAAEENAFINKHKYLSEKGVTYGEFILHMLPGVLLISLQTYLQLRLNFRGIRNIAFKGSPEVMKMQRLIKTLKRTADTMGTFSQDEKVVKTTLLRQIRRMRIRLRKMAKVDKPHEDFHSNLATLKHLYPLRDKVLLVKCCITLVLMMIFFVICTITNIQKLSVAWIAILGPLLLFILVDIEEMETVLLRVEWGTCLFLATFFVLMQGLIRLGVTYAIGEWTISAVLYFSPEHRFAAALLLLLWISGLSSAFIYSVPIANTMIHVSVTLATNSESPMPLHPLVWALTFGTCLGNNGTLISGFPNVICAGISEHHGYKFRFKRFLIVCFPIMIGGLIMTTIYLLLCHIAGSWH